mmetsp:Transcript_35084/g.69354  ORF Transcript_35084/g.69354 Transcript_35084/m.69354 type:complete len:208 (-) Transcript_35084:1034-1657(-)
MSCCGSNAEPDNAIFSRQNLHQFDGVGCLTRSLAKPVRTKGKHHRMEIARPRVSTFAHQEAGAFNCAWMSLLCAMRVPTTSSGGVTTINPAAILEALLADWKRSGARISSPYFVKKDAATVSSSTSAKRRGPGIKSLVVDDSVFKRVTSNAASPESSSSLVSAPPKGLSSEMVHPFDAAIRYVAMASVALPTKVHPACTVSIQGILL